MTIAKVNTEIEKLSARGGSLTEEEIRPIKTAAGRYLDSDERSAIEMFLKGLNGPAKTSLSQFLTSSNQNNPLVLAQQNVQTSARETAAQLFDMGIPGLAIGSILNMLVLAGLAEQNERVRTALMNFNFDLRSPLSPKVKFFFLISSPTIIGGVCGVFIGASKADDTAKDSYLRQKD